jgi:drug/metabolite transporter (DMT)-like permease
VVFPIVSLGLSTLFEGYHWTGTAFVGVLLILIGNLVVLMRWPGRGWRGKPWEKSEGRTA